MSAWHSCMTAQKLDLLEEVGEIALPALAATRMSSCPASTWRSMASTARPTWRLSDPATTSFTLVNVHLFFGDETDVSMERRALETFAVAKWCDLRKKSKFSFTRELMALGDFNMPKAEPGDPIYKALTSLGLELPDHSTQISSSISSDANYDQIAFLPQTTKDLFTGLKGVFDYDAVIFPALWGDGHNKGNFKAYLRYYISDHRPMWVQLKLFDKGQDHRTLDPGKEHRALNKDKEKAARTGRGPSAKLARPFPEAWSFR